MIKGLQIINEKPSVYEIFRLVKDKTEIDKVCCIDCPTLKVGESSTTFFDEMDIELTKTENFFTLSSNAYSRLGIYFSNTVPLYWFSVGIASKAELGFESKKWDLAYFLYDHYRVEIFFNEKKIDISVFNNLSFKEINFPGTVYDHLDFN